MGRHADTTAQYRVSIHANGGYRYASTQPAVVDSETGEKRYRRVHWGTVDENLKFIPGKQYIIASPEERKKLIFPEGWDLSEAEKLSGRRKQGRPAIEGQDENRLYGDIWLLEQIAEATGIRKDLSNVFDGNTEMADIIMTLAMFLLCGKGTYSQLQSWQRIAKAPYPGSLPSPMITKVTQSITEQDRMALLRLRMARVGEGSLLAVDSTGRSAWGDSLCDIRYGKSKDHLPLPQTTEAVAYTLEGHMPVYYRTFPGNIPDSRSLETILRDLESAGMRDVVLVTDRGYESIRNLEAYIDRGQAMVMGTKVSQAHVMERIRAFGVFGHHPEGMEIDVDERIYYRQYEMEYRIEGRRGNVKPSVDLRLNLYFDPARRSQEMTDIDVEIVCQRKALEQVLNDRTPLDDDRTVARAYSFFRLEYDEATRILKGFTLDEDKVERKRAKAGFFANTTHKIDEGAMETQRHYRLRDEQEKYFAMMKGAMGADRQRNWSESGKTGRLFILFVAQILGCYLSNVRVTKLKDSFDSAAAVLNEMRPIRYIEHKGTKPYITPFVGKQVEICEAFGFEIPEGCAPEYVVRKTNKGKPGRPRKNKIVVKEDS